MAETLTTGEPLFRCRDARVYVDDKPIVRGVDLEIGRGELHVLMGPNGSGKSTLAAGLAGHPLYRLEGEVWLRGERIDGLTADERARRGLFLGFQYPVAVPGLAVGTFLRAAVEVQRGAAVELRTFRKELVDGLTQLGLPAAFAGRYLNDGFSGGEKKRLELVQLLLLRPAFALLDEIDSGLDVDALKLVAAGIQQAAQQGTAVLLVTHYQRILDHLRPDRVHVFREGAIVRSGDAALAAELDQHGYDWVAAPAAGG